MGKSCSTRIGAIAAAALLGAALAAPDFAAAVDTRDPGPVRQAPQAAPPSQGVTTGVRSGTAKTVKKRTAKKSKAVKPAKAARTVKTKRAKRPPPQPKQQSFLQGYRAAHDLIYKRQDYAAAIPQLRALGQDHHPDVANLIGFASRKLGRYDDAKSWYEKALAADPKHARTWSYYGMWHAEHGNLLKAAEYLDTVRGICGNTTCREYAELKAVIDGAGTY
jgi:tetratricopeptide (TPR) repeat protein